MRYKNNVIRELDEDKRNEILCVMDKLQDMLDSNKTSVCDTQIAQCVYSVRSDMEYLESLLKKRDVIVDTYNQLIRGACKHLYELDARGVPMVRKIRNKVAGHEFLILTDTFRSILRDIGYMKSSTEFIREINAFSEERCGTSVVVHVKPGTYITKVIYNNIANVKYIRMKLVRDLVGG